MENNLYIQIHAGKPKINNSIFNFSSFGFEIINTIKFQRFSKPNSKEVSDQTTVFEQIAKTLDKVNTHQFVVWFNHF